MTAASGRYDRAIALFDAANAQDPNRQSVDGKSGGREIARELLYAQRMSAMLERFVVAPSEALRLAARGQHLQRWKRPRSEYPMTKPGYNLWRANARQFHAELAGDLLREAGYDDGMIARVGALLRKEALKSDPDSQALEDVVGLVFIAHYLGDFVAAHAGYDEGKLLDIMTKTARKMSARGRAAARATIELPSHLRAVVDTAMAAAR